MNKKNEHKFQIEFVNWLETQDDVFYTMVPNEVGMFKNAPDYRQVINVFTHLGFKKGLPDMLFIMNNELFFIELKDGNKKTSIYQDFWIDKLQKAGVKTYICRNLDECKQIILDKR